MSEETRLKELIIQQSTFQDEILDTIEDNSPAFIDQSPDLMQTCITKIEKLRIQYRSINNEIKAEMPTDRYEESLQKLYTTTIAKVSEYIRTLNKLTQQHRLSTVKSDEEVISQQAQLVIQEIERSFIYLKASSTCVVSHLKNDDLKQRKSLLESQSKEVKGISNKLKELIGLRPKMDVYTNLKQRYETLITSTSDYQLRIESEIKSRLNIKLSTFTGYDADIDIYSFIDEFEKLYSDSVPVSLQAELLKNNHLAKQALSLIKNIDNISEIWERLKRVFGDKEVLLQHKLSELCLLYTSPSPRDS